MTATNRDAIWVLLGPHKGDNDQVFALAEAIGLPFRTIELRYRWFAHVPAALRRVGIGQLDARSRSEIAGPWPALVLGIGQRSAPVARYIKRASDGRTKIVRLGDPMISPGHFDLVITTIQYAVRDAANVIRLPITITNRKHVGPDEREQRWLKAFAHPRRLIVIGGKTSLWKVGPDVVRDCAASLRARAERDGGSVIAVTSPRTSPALIAAAQVALGEEAVVAGPFPHYGALLKSADEIHVTGDSVSMLSDAVASGKPVGLIPLQPNFVATFLRVTGALRGRPWRVRDLEKFWADLRQRGLVGTVDRPRAGSLDNAPVEIAVAAVRALIDLPADQAAPVRTAQRPNSARAETQAVAL